MNSTYDTSDRGVTPRVAPPVSLIKDKFSIGIATTVQPDDGLPNTMKKREPYLRGPIPLHWLRVAYCESPSCLMVGMVLWHYRALTKSLTFPLSLKKLASVSSVSYRTAQRAVKILSELNLIQVKHKAGSKNTFTINVELDGDSPPLTDVVRPSLKGVGAVVRMV